MIGAGYNGGVCGDILISGGTITATANKDFNAAIGSGYADQNESICGNITITGDDTVVTATRGDHTTYSVGPGYDSKCGTVTVGGVVGYRTEKVFKYPFEHTHNWSYVASGSSITASCSNSDCPAITGLTLTLQAPDNLVYDETNKVCSFAAEYSEAAFGTPSTKYYKNNSLVSECVDAGVYEASVTVGGATAKLQFEIAKANPAYVVPSGLRIKANSTLSMLSLPTGFTWVDPTQNVGSTTGNFTFKANYTPSDNDNYNVVNNIDIPVEVYVHEHNWSYVANGSSILASCSNPECSVDTGLTLSLVVPTNLVFDDSAKTASFELGYSSEAFGTPSIEYYENDSLVSECIDAGIYEARVTVGGATAKLQFEIAKANPTYVVPSTIDAPYDVELSTIGLPEGFSWMDGTQKTSTWGENAFKAKYTPSDTVNYNVVENIDIKVNVKWILVDPTEGDVSVTINDRETEYNVDISVKVEIKTEISTEQKRTDYADIGKEFIKKNEDIGAIYSVKLIRTVGGVEEEIQPSDIKPGTKVTISMVLPDELAGKDFRLLHIHNSHDVEEISNSKYGISGDGKTVILQTDRLSEFAFIIAAEGDNGFDYSTGLPGWAIALIIVGSILLLCLLCFFLLFFVFNKWIRKDDKALRAVKFGKKDNKVRLLVMPFKFEYREESQIFNSKSEALK